MQGISGYNAAKSTYFKISRLVGPIQYKLNSTSLDATEPNKPILKYAEVSLQDPPGSFHFIMTNYVIASSDNPKTMTI